MKKLVLIMLVGAILGLVLFFDYIYYPIMSFRAAGIAERYIEDKYNEDFIIEDVHYSKQLGHHSGEYHITAYSNSNKDVYFQINDQQNMTSPEDNYLENKWRIELNKEVQALIKNTYSSHFNLMVNFVFPPTAISQYSAKDSYQLIVKEETGKVENYVYLNILNNPATNLEEELSRLYKIIMEFKHMQLRDFSLNVRYYDNEIVQDMDKQDKQISYHQFTNKYFQSHGTLAFNFDTRNNEHSIKLLALRSPDDLEEFFIGFTK
jgi:hypothetical protein